MTKVLRGLEITYLWIAAFVMGGFGFQPFWDLAMYYNYPDAVPDYPPAVRAYMVGLGLFCLVAFTGLCAWRRAWGRRLAVIGEVGLALATLVFLPGAVSAGIAALLVAPTTIFAARRGGLLPTLPAARVG